MKRVIFFWSKNEMFYLTDTDNDTTAELNKRLAAMLNSTGIIGGVIGTDSEIPDFAIDLTNE